MPLPMPRFQTDGRTEFFAERVRKRLREHCSEFRPVKPRSPQLKGKVEGLQKTDLSDLRATT